MSETACRAPASTSGRRIALAIFVASTALGCANHGSDNHLYREDRAGFGRALVLPLNVVVETPPELKQRANRVESVLHEHLAQHGKSIETITPGDARAEWLASAKECGSGTSGACKGLDEGARFLAQRLGREKDFDALIVPYLSFRTAKGGPITARWDGVERPVETSGWGLRSGGPMAITRVEMRGISLAVVAFSREGEKIFEGIGGLELADRIRSPGGTVMKHELRDDLFADPELLREGVAIALDPLVPSADGA